MRKNEVLTFGYGRARRIRVPCFVFQLLVTKYPWKALLKIIDASNEILGLISRSGLGNRRV